MTAFVPPPSVEPEQWRPIPEWEGLYMVSDLGRVLRLAHEPVPGVHHRRSTQRLMNPCMTKRSESRDPSLVVGLSRLGSGTNTSRTVATLVLQCFEGEAPMPGGVAGFKDGDPANVRLSNLYWTTPAARAAAKMPAESEQEPPALMNPTQLAQRLGMTTERVLGTLERVGIKPLHEHPLDGRRKLRLFESAAALTAVQAVVEAERREAERVATEEARVLAEAQERKQAEAKTGDEDRIRIAAIGLLDGLLTPMFERVMEESHHCEQRLAERLAERLDSAVTKITGELRFQLGAQLSGPVERMERTMKLLTDCSNDHLALGKRLGGSFNDLRNSLTGPIAEIKGLVRQLSERPAAPPAPAPVFPHSTSKLVISAESTPTPPAAQREVSHEPKRAKLNVVVVGLLGAQAQMIAREFSEELDVTFYGSDEVANRAFASKIKNADVVIGMLKFPGVNHVLPSVVHAAGKRLVRVTGGMSSLRDKLTSLYVNGVEAETETAEA